MRLLEGCNPYFLAAYLNSAHGRSWIASVVNQQVGQANVNGSKLQALAFPLPPATEQERIAVSVREAISSSVRYEQLIQSQMMRCAALRQSILKRAFSGKLVPQDPNDEPASLLLERIRAGRASNGTIRRKSRRSAAAVASKE